MNLFENGINPNMSKYNVGPITADVSHDAGTFACLKLDPDQAEFIAQWCQEHGIPCQDPYDLHCTVLSSEQGCPELQQFDGMRFNIPAKVMGYKQMGPALALELECPGSHRLHELLMKNTKATYNWPSFIPHMSLYYGNEQEFPERFPLSEINFVEMQIMPLDLNFSN